MTLCLWTYKFLTTKTFKSLNIAANNTQQSRALITSFRPELERDQLLNFINSRIPFFEWTVEISLDRPCPVLLRVSTLLRFALWLKGLFLFGCFEYS